MFLSFKIIEYASQEYQKSLLLREEVMRKPLGIQLSDEDIRYDYKRIHIGGYYENELICGCSLGIFHRKIAHIYSVFVKQELQNQGIGQLLMTFAENYTKSNGVTRLYVEGRKAAKGFYLKCGFSPCGNEYTDMNILHQDMRKDIL